MITVHMTTLKIRTDMELTAGQQQRLMDVACDYLNAAGIRTDVASVSQCTDRDGEKS